MEPIFAQNLPHKLFSLKKTIFFILMIPAVFASIVVIALFFEASSPPKEIAITNVSSGQATVSWTTDKPTKGVILISDNGRFPLSPIVADLIYKDDDEKGTPTIARYLTHSVTIGKLESDTRYQYRIYQGLKKVYQGEFKTAPILSDIATPNPVYGQVLAADGKTPVVGALVFLRVENNSVSSSILSTLTNLNGRWSIDLANLRTSDLKGPFTQNKTSVNQLIVESGNKGRFKSATSSAFTKPWATIILKAKK